MILKTIQVLTILIIAVSCGENNSESISIKENNSVSDTVNETDAASIETIENDSVSTPDIEESLGLEGSQMEITLDAEASVVSTKQRLDSVFNAVLAEYKSDQSFIKNIQKSQDLWFMYFEAQMLARFPEDHESREGSVFNTCWFGYREKLYKERIATLQDWLDGFREGEVCGGTVKVRA